MRTFSFIAVSILALAAALNAAGPALTGVVNPASNIPPGLPNYGIAQGSIFVIYGSGLGPAVLTQAAVLPLPTTAGLAGTTVSVTVNGTTLAAPLVYTSQSQVAAILPSATPVGTGAITVSYNGASGSSPLAVVTSDFGIATVNQNGSGPGVVTFPNGALVTQYNSAKPGDTLVIWGTGLGPISGSDAALPTPTDLGTPIQVYLGTAPATVLYRGRSASPGLDQINILVPQAASLGCGVSIVIQTGSLVSNTVSIPIASGGGTCTDPTVLTTLPSFPVGATSYSFAFFSLFSLSGNLGSGSQSSSLNSTAAGAVFERVPVPAATTPTTGTTTDSTSTITSIGSCQVLASGYGSVTGGGGGSDPTTTPVTYLDAGKSILATPPTGSPDTLTLQSPGTYSANLTSLPAGNWQFSNGAGGVDIGPFTFQAPISPLVWTNQSAAATTIDRTQPFTVTWTGGDPSTTVEIGLTSESINTTNLSFALVEVNCTAQASAGQFTVPPYVLLSLIPNATASSVSVSSGISKYVTIPGIDLAYFLGDFSTSVSTPATKFK